MRYRVIFLYIDDLRLYIYVIYHIFSLCRKDTSILCITSVKDFH
jgi:hypothetical protein